MSSVCRTRLSVIAAAACEMHPRAVLKAAETRGVHDELAEEPFLAFMLSRMSWPAYPVPVGVLRAVAR